ncbi:group II trans-sialidase superfamily, partial [Trypanosoma conorhini]
MPRRLFSAAVLLLLVLLICCCGCGAVHAEGEKPNQVKLPQSVELFAPKKTQVQKGNGKRSMDSFASPSLASAGGVLVALAEGHINYTGPNSQLLGYTYSDIVAGYINAAAGWASLVAEINAGRWEAHTVFSRERQANRVGRAFYPTAVAKDNKVFLLVGSYDMIDDGSDSHLKEGNWSLELLVGEATQDKQIQWGQPQQLLPQIAQSAQAIGVDGFFSAGGSGVVMANGALVFPVVANKGGETSSLVSTIIYSTDGGQHWALAQGMLPTDCTSSLLAEWEAGQLLMIADCTFGHKVFESRDMGATWAETVRTLSRVRGDSESDPLQEARLVTSLTTATIAGKAAHALHPDRVPTR